MSTSLIIYRMTSLKKIMERARDIILSMNLMQKTMMTLSPVCNVLAESGIEGHEKSIMMLLSTKQVVKITSSDVPMYLRKSPSETLIDQSTTQNMLLRLLNTNLPTRLVASSAKKLLIFNCCCHLKKNLRSRKFCPRSQRPQRHLRLSLQNSFQSSIVIII
jgi:hypothetical protein